ncbi:MAG: type II toxin-antitoxin system VapB family antitoxin [Ignavibacteriaceae bacterium]|nr:type II toxin-antitoxin system VapB family antitoxin [Ignavibacterium sp.]MCC6254546.1 type II toxin-antitoxin system VapB family antitoxin [Ignavibacteriaceae bacterium]HRN26873.1 type II toxin-antitoxin system VapB family antitoxin [Ignavibacteriaceae bacterium]HRP92653.1 type II toxin-antitoxin system VapB family antitoxin [Ignavibacteriaceae bacterium]HRQ54491.1 type II toxin-antitoxin system VapB family antitoxin [Ignavibacteriaceae bacterium]
MPTNLNINDSLLEKAVILGKHKSKKEAVNTALEEYVKLRNQMKIKDLFNTIEYDKNYNYKKQRSRK